ncbi:MAG: cysteine hydrolase [Thermoprotei archaeon]
MPAICLIVWDMQKGIAPNAFNYHQILQNVKLLVEAARKASLPVIFSQHTGLPSLYMSEYSRESLRRRGVDPSTARYMAEGSPEWAFVEGLTPTADDLVIRKHTPSFFVGTYLEQALRNRGVSTIVLCGVATEVGIVGTASHGAALGFIPIIVEDAVGGRAPETHEAALKVMGSIFRVVKTTEAVAMFEGKIG